MSRIKFKEYMENEVKTNPCIISYALRNNVVFLLIKNSIENINEIVTCELRIVKGAVMNYYTHREQHCVIMGCPKYLLDQSTNNNVDAIQWRNDSNEYLNTMRERKKALKV